MITTTTFEIKDTIIFETIKKAVPEEKIIGEYYLKNCNILVVIGKYFPDDDYGDEIEIEGIKIACSGIDYIENTGEQEEIRAYYEEIYGANVMYRALRKNMMDIIADMKKIEKLGLKQEVGMKGYDLTMVRFELEEAIEHFIKESLKIYPDNKQDNIKERIE